MPSNSAQGASARVRNVTWLRRVEAFQHLQSIGVRVLMLVPPNNMSNQHFYTKRVLSCAHAIIKYQLLALSINIAQEHWLG